MCGTLCTNASLNTLLWCAVILSLGSLGFEVASLCTQNWASGTYTVGALRSSQTSSRNFNYGLIQGTFQEEDGDLYPLCVCCNVAYGMCMMYATNESCLQADSFDATFDFGNIVHRNNVVQGHGCRDYIKEMSRIESVSANEDLMPYGYYVGTVSCFALGCFFSLLAAVCGLLNAFCKTCCCSILCRNGCGLFVYHGLAIVCLLCCMGTGGYMILHYLPLPQYVHADALGVVHSTSRNLDYSYWLLLGAAVLHLVSIAILSCSRKRVVKQPTVVRTIVVQQ